MNMSGTVYKSAAGALLMQTRLDVLSNNLANVNTIGFKADKPVFRVNELKSGSSSSVPSHLQLSSLAPPMNFMTNYAPGSLRQTGNDMDMAIVGNGFFEVQTPDGPQFTRKGNFSINAQGVLSTAEGWPVMGQGGEIPINGSRIKINDQGEVRVDDNLVDTLRVVDFPQPYDLKKSGDNFFVPDKTDTRQKPAQEYRIAQGHVELSNVNPIQAMTELIETLRIFSLYQKVIKSSDDATAKTVSEVGRAV
jgi:flagellar basal-body rod protein FlgG